MKNIYLLFVLIFGLSNVQAEGYKPVLSQNLRWNIFQGVCDGGETQTYTVTRDSTNNTTIYSSIVHTFDNTKMGYLTEDTVLGKVSYYEFFSNLEYLIYDISLDVGDTFSFYSYGGNKNDVLVKDVYTSNGLKTICFENTTNMCIHEDTVKFIEGVGPNIGFNYQGTPSATSANSYLLCTYANNEVIYSNELFGGECEMNWTEVEDVNKEIAILFTTNSLEINNFKGKGRIEFYNILGAKLYETNIEHGQNTIQLDHISAEVIIYKLRIGDEFFTDKVRIK